MKGDGSGMHRGSWFGLFLCVLVIQRNSVPRVTRSCTFLAFQRRPSEPQVSSRETPLRGAWWRGARPGVPLAGHAARASWNTCFHPEHRNKVFPEFSRRGSGAGGGVQEHHPPRQAVWGPDCASFLPLSINIVLVCSCVYVSLTIVFNTICGFLIYLANVFWFTFFRRIISAWSLL